MIDSKYGSVRGACVLMKSGILMEWGCGKIYKVDGEEGGF